MLIASWTAGLDELHTKWRGSNLWHITWNKKMIINLWYLMVSLVNTFMMSNEWLCFFVVISIHLHFTFFSLLFHRRILSHFFQTNKQKTTKTTKPSPKQEFQLSLCIYIYMGVSKNRDTPKWMVYNGKPYQNGWFGAPIYIYIYFIIQTVGFSPSFRGYR